MKIKRFDHIVITTHSLEKCLYFYTEILGMEQEYLNGKYAVRFGEQKINIHTRKGEFQPAARNVTCGSQDICLIAEGNIEDIMAELKARGAEIELGIVSRTGALGPISSIYLRDPDGNLVEISTYPFG